MAKNTNKPFIRSIIDLGDFNDDEINTLPSMTDPSQDEPIEALVARMMRGELVSSSQPQYDTGSELDSESVFRLQAATSKDGFDIADAAPILERAKNGLSELKIAQAMPTPTPEPAPAPAAPQAAPLPDK